MQPTSAGVLKTKFFSVEGAVDTPINQWIKENPNAVIIDIKFQTSNNEDYWFSEALIIYREGVLLNEHYIQKSHIN